MDKTKLSGIVLALAGLLHFVKPELFEPITAPAFPNDTRKYLYINGTLETAIGVGLALPQTRKFGIAGAIAYVAYLAANAVRNRS